MSLIKEIQFLTWGFLFLAMSGFSRVQFSSVYHLNSLLFFRFFFSRFYGFTAVSYLTPHEFFILALTDGFTLESEWQQNSGTFLSILAHSSTAVVRIVSILLKSLVHRVSFSGSWRLFQEPRLWLTSLLSSCSTNYYYYYYCCCCCMDF